MSIAISGFTSNSLYFTGNDIWARIYETSVLQRTFVKSLTVQVEGVNGEFKYYPSDQGDFHINLSPIVRLAFEQPQQDPDYVNPTPYVSTTNFAKKKVIFTVNKTYGTESVNRTSNFIRGYKRTNGSNITADYDKYLTNSDKIPVWPGYPSAGYIVYNPVNAAPGTTTNIYKVINLPSSIKEIMRIKGCESTYVKFMNSQGGYSSWLFEKREQSHKNEQLGYSETRQGYTDFGSYGENEHKLQSKVPERYFGLIQDLIESPEVYIYNPSAAIAADKWQRIILEDNTITENTWDSVYQVSIDVKAPLKYNPSLIW